MTLQQRHWRQGETWLFFATVMLAIFACYGLSAAGALMQNSLLKVSAEFMGADRIISSTRMADHAWLQQAKQRNIRYSEQWHFNSMLFAGAGVDAPMQLVSIKAVDSFYPVKGQLDIASANGVLTNRPSAGQLYLDPRLKELLGVQLGQYIELGVERFEIAGWLNQEPDAGMGVFGNLPSVLMQLEDVERTEIVQPGSRIRYRYLLTGEENALQQFDEWLTPQLNSIYKYQTIHDKDFALAKSLQRNEQVLRLAGLLTLLLSLAAIAVIANRFAEQQQREVALLKALGLTQRTLGLRYFRLLVSLWGLASVMGLLLAHGALGLLVLQLSVDMPFLQHEWVIESVLLSLCAGIGGSAFFIWRPFRLLLSTSAASLIKGSLLRAHHTSWRWTLLLVLFIAFMLLAFSNSWRLAIILFMAGFLAMSLVVVLSRILLHGLERFSLTRSLSYRFAVRNLSRKLTQNRLLISGFSLASVMVMSLFFLRNDLIASWKEQLPDGAANHFAMNIQPQQKEPFLNWLQEKKLPISYVYPVIRGRLAEVNGQLASERVKAHDNEGKRYISRELNLTYRNDLPEGNELIQGSFVNADGEVSVESSMAEQLSLQLGDELRFDIAGQTILAKVTSIRRVDWNSLRPNFYIILSDDLLRPFSATYLASFHLSAQQPQLANQLARQFPTVTLINVDSILKRLEVVIRHSSVALSVILGLVSCAAILLLVAQIRAGLDARQVELITLHILGASRQLLVKITLLEFALLGLLAGFIGVVITEAMLAALFYWLFGLTPQWHPVLWLLGPVFSYVLISLFGWHGCKHLLREGTLMRLRAQISGG